MLENIWSFVLSLSLSSEQPKFLLLLTALTNTPKHMLSKATSAKSLVCQGMGSCVLWVVTLATPSGFGESKGTKGFPDDLTNQSCIYINPEGTR